MNGKIDLLEKTEHGKRISQKDFGEETTVKQSQPKKEDGKMSNEPTQETTVKTVNLREYFGKNWRRSYLAKKDDVVEMFGQLGIDGYEFVRIASRMSINDDRCVVIVVARKPDNGHLAKIAIDVKLGDPTWRQLIDLMYGFGSNSGIKIVLLAGESSGECDPTIEEFWIWNLFRWINCCGVSTYLAEAKGALQDGSKMGISYSLIERPGDGNQKNGSRLPSREDYEEEEFWFGCYNSVAGFGVPFMDSYDDIERGSRWYYLFEGNLVTAPTWTDLGFFMNVVGMPGSEALKWLWRERRSKIEMYYPGCPMTLVKKSGKPCKITVRVSEEPFRNCLYSTLEEKEEYAKWVLRQEEKFFEIIERILDKFPAKARAEFVYPDDLLEYL